MSPRPRAGVALAERCRGSAGVATVLLPMTLWFATLVAIAAIDVTAYLVAAARAQSLADAAALAAVAPDVPGAATTRGPRGEARRVVLAGDGALERCACGAGRQQAAVTVSVPVPGLVVPTLGASRVSADARAVLAPPPDLPAGPTRTRDAWSVPP